MNLAIHYNGKLENRARLEEMLDEARYFCAEQRWSYLDIEESIKGQVERLAESPQAETERGAGVETPALLFPIDDTLTGISITVHPASEPLRLTFNRAGELAYYIPLNDGDVYWEIKSFSTGTQSGFETHIAVCELLRLLRDRYMPGLNVYDEANYFETGDAMRLASSIEEAETDADLPVEVENPDEGWR